MFRLREWLFLNAVAAVANADEAGVAMSFRSEQMPLSGVAHVDKIQSGVHECRELVIEKVGDDLAGRRGLPIVVADRRGRIDDNHRQARTRFL